MNEMANPTQTRNLLGGDRLRNMAGRAVQLAANPERAVSVCAVQGRMAKGMGQEESRAGGRVEGCVNRRIRQPEGSAGEGE